MRAARWLFALYVFLMVPGPPTLMVSLDVTLAILKGQRLQRIEAGGLAVEFQQSVVP